MKTPEPKKTVELILYARLHARLIAVVQRRGNLCMKTDELTPREFPWGLQASCRAEYGGTESALDALWRALDETFGDYDFMPKRDDELKVLLRLPDRIVYGCLIDSSTLSDLRIGPFHGSLHILGKSAAKEIEPIALAQRPSYDARVRDGMLRCHHEALLKGFSVFSS